jgi:hypothetical protein
MSDMMEAFHVHVDNVDEINRVVSTEEKEPEHFVCLTFVVPEPSAGVGGGQTNVNVVKVCELNPMRKSITIAAIDSAIVLCHTYAQAQDAANQTALVPFPQGAYLPAGGTASLDGTGQLWACSAVGVTTRVSVIENVRGE